MKRIALLLFIMCICAVFCACGAETAQTNAEATVPDTSIALELTEATNTEPEYDLTPEGYFVTEFVQENGTKVTECRDGGPAGPLVRVEYLYQSGDTAEETYDNDGNLACRIYWGIDGSTNEETYYPSGCLSKNIVRNADGSYGEWHHADDGDPWTPGTVTYNKIVSADGQVQEYHYDIRKEEDGSWWRHTTQDDGTVYDTHYNAAGDVIESIMENPTTGFKSHRKLHADGSLKYVYEERVGYKMEMAYDEEGYCTRYFYQDPVGTREATIDENGKLVKFTMDGVEQNVSNWVHEIGCRS